MGVARRYDSVVCCAAGNDNVSEYNQGITQSISADQPIRPRGRCTEDNIKNIESKYTSSLSIFPKQMIAK